MTRLPSTGIITSWCASVAPNHYLKIILFIAVYFNYLALYFPFLLAVIRLIIVSFPITHFKINKQLVRFGIPFLLVLPICFTFYLVPALGVCRPRAAPFPFGSVWIHFIDSAFGLTNRYFHLSNLVFWMSCSIIANMILFYKIRQARSMILSPELNEATKKANTSITITTIAMIIFYMTTGVFLVMFILYYGTSSYFSYTEIFRPFGNDLQFFVVTWVFYLSHPAFRYDPNRSGQISPAGSWLWRRMQNFM